MQDLIGKAKAAGGAELDKLGGGLNFPASKDEIVEQAKQKHLPPEVISQLEKIPDKKYDNLGDVIVSTVKS